MTPAELKAQKYSHVRAETLVRDLARRTGGDPVHCACGNWYVARELSTCPVCCGRSRRDTALTAHFVCCLCGQAVDKCSCDP